MHSSVSVYILNCNPFKRRKSLSSNLLVNKIRNRKIWRRFLYVAQQVGSNRRCTGRPHDVELTWVYKCWEKTWENLPIYTKWFVLETHFIQQVFCPPWFREFPIDIFLCFFFGSASWLKALTEIYLRSRWRFPSRNWIIVIHGGNCHPFTSLSPCWLICICFVLSSGKPVECFGNWGLINPQDNSQGFFFVAAGNFEDYAEYGGQGASDVGIVSMVSDQILYQSSCWRSHKNIYIYRWCSFHSKWCRICSKHISEWYTNIDLNQIIFECFLRPLHRRSNKTG